MSGGRLETKPLRRLLVLTGDHGLADPTKWDGAYGEDDLRLHRAMCDALTSLGRWEIDVCSDHAQLIARLQADPPDLVLNFCDTGFNNVATQELHVPALLEMFGVPYTGAPPAAMVIAYDKALVNLIASSLGVAVPQERVVAAGAPVDARDIAYPALVKPQRGDGSVGINRGAVVRSEAELNRQLAWLHGAIPGQPALVQEYLPGAEYGLALLGNPGRLRAPPMLEVDYAALPPDVPRILAFESKTGPDNPYDHVKIVRAELDPSTVAALVADASRLFARVGFRDYARFDFRTSADGVIKLMEVNPNPAWSRDAKLALMARFEGLAYPRLLETIIDAAWARVSER